MKILLVSATSFEIAPFIDYLEKEFTNKSFFEFQKGETSIYVLVTGVGAMNTSFALARMPKIADFDLAINVGLAGAFSKNIDLGKVVEVNKDRFADIGVEEADGSFTDTYELELMNPNQFPFTDGILINNNKYDTRLTKMNAITVNKVHGSLESINQIRAKYNPELETMEGAGFLYACQIMDINAVQIRAISNHVLPRNKDKWEISLAIKNLNDYLVGFVGSLG